MSVLSPQIALPGPLPLYRLSVEQYHQMIRNGIFKDEDRVELLEGLVPKRTQKPPHTLAAQTLIDLIPSLLPPGWVLNVQAPLTTTESEPEPDAAVVRGQRRHNTLQDRHPRPADMGLVIEVADSSLATDR